MTVVFDVSGEVRYDTAVPDGFVCQCQLHWDAFPHRPPLSTGPLKSVSGRALASEVYESTCDVLGFWALSEPLAPRYHRWAVVPGMGQVGNDCSKVGYGFPAVV